jgi:endoribonuclease Dicer
VNRKGVALPTTSEEKKKAKRENLEQKQILVPELCKIHPFPASLWRKAVCLPCILHRVNALLLADEIRQIVAEEIALGSTKLDNEFDWPPLDFGWSLSKILVPAKPVCKPEVEVVNHVNSEHRRYKSIENGFENDKRSELEIGTWSNEMAKDCNNDLLNLDDYDSGISLPQNVTLINHFDQSDLSSLSVNGDLVST